MSYEDYVQQIEEARQHYDERMERLQLQEAVNVGRLRVEDEDVIRTLLMAGMGGSY